jgi:hypothetical protein
MSTVQFLTRRQAADLMGIAAKTLSNWAVRSYGPRVYNPSGGKALYDRDEVIGFVNGPYHPGSRITAGSDSVVR